MDASKRTLTTSRLVAAEDASCFLNDKMVREGVESTEMAEMELSVVGVTALWVLPPKLYTPANVAAPMTAVLRDAQRDKRVVMSDSSHKRKIRKEKELPLGAFKRTYLPIICPAVPAKPKPIQPDVVALTVISRELPS